MNSTTRSESGTNDLLVQLCLPIRRELGREHGSPLATFVCLVLIATQLGFGATRLSAQRPAPFELPEPSLEAMEPGARARIESARERVAEGQRSGDIRSVAGALADLGRLYLAFDLFDAAGAAFDAAVQNDGSDAMSLYYLAICRNAQGDPRSAVTNFERFIQEHSEDGSDKALQLPALLRLGGTLLDLDEVKSAEAVYRRASALAPSDAAVLYGVGRVFAARKDYNAAVERFKRALEIQPDASVVRYPLGQALRRLGDIDAARLQLSQRGDQAVSFPDPLADEIAWLAISGAFDAVASLAAVEDGFSERDYLGFVLAQFGSVEGAIEPLKSALEVRESEAKELPAGSAAAKKEQIVQARIRYALAGLLIKHRRDPEAEVELRLALKLAPSLRDARVKLGNLRVRGGDLEGGVAAYGEALDLDRDLDSARLKRGAARMALGQYEEAAEDLEILRERLPEDPEVLLRLARVRERLGDVEAAGALYEFGTSLELEARELAAMHYELGRLDRAAGRLDGALARFEQALTAHPELHVARFDRATVLGGLGRFGDAQAGYRELIEREPQHESARLGEATALSLLGDFPAAAARLAEGVEEMPTSLVLTHALARLLASVSDPNVRNGRRSLELAQQLVAAVPTVDHVETLAMALASLGRFEEAIQVQRELVEQVRAKGRSADLSRLLEQQSLYEAGRPCCPEEAG